MLNTESILDVSKILQNVKVFFWTCPECGQRITFPNLNALYLAQAAGGCQGCRARKTLLENPHLATVFVEFFDRVGYPQSDSWLEVLERN